MGDYDENDPLIDHTKDRDDDGDTTGAFQRGSSSTAAPNGQQQRTTTMNREDDHVEFLTETRSEAALIDEFPRADLFKIKTSYDVNGRLQIALKNPTGRQSKGTFYLYTKDRSTGEMRLNKSMPKSILIYLGESKEAQLERERGNLRQEIETNEELKNDSNADLQKRGEATRELSALKQRFKALSKELNRLIQKRNGAPSETIELEEFTVREKERQDKEKDLQQKKKSKNRSQMIKTKQAQKGYERAKMR